MKFIPKITKNKAIATVPGTDGLITASVFHILNEKMIPKTNEKIPNTKLKNLISGFLKQYS